MRSAPMPFIRLLTTLQGRRQKVNRPAEILVFTHP